MSEVQQFYQAIGELQATLVVTEDGAKFLQSGSEQYPVFIPRKCEKKYQDKFQGQHVYWRVYPRAEELSLAFYVIAVASEPKIGTGQFVLQGDWIESGQLQIWRNPNPGIINPHNWRPRLLPINWEDAPAPDDAFWQLKAQLVDGALKIVEAAGPFPHPPRLEKRPKLNEKQPPSAQRVREAQAEPQAKSGATTNTQTIDWEGITPVDGKLELSVKINTLPQVQQVNGQCHFKLNCDGRVFQVSVKPKQWAKLETANASYDSWVAAIAKRSPLRGIAGKLGPATADGFVLEEPNIQVFQRQARPSDSSPLEQDKAAVSSSPKAETKTQSASTAVAKTAALSLTKPEGSSDPVEPLARPAATDAEARPKKIGKLNVQVR